jgi:hypothetical protein
MANGLETVLPSRPTSGMELLHLTGNFLFLAGLAGVMVITHRAPSSISWTRARG